MLKAILSQFKTCSSVGFSSSNKRLVSGIVIGFLILIAVYVLRVLSLF